MPLPGKLSNGLTNTIYLDRVKHFQQVQQLKEQEELRLFQSHEATSSASSSSNPGLNPLWVPVSSVPEPTSYSLTCECFFLTARVLNLELMKAFSDYNVFGRQRLLHQKDLSILILLRGVGAPPDLENRISDAQASVDRLLQEQYCYDTQLVKDHALIQSALRFYRLMIIRLVGLTEGFKMPLPIPCPMEFASMPGHFIEDCLDILVLAPQIHAQAITSDRVKGPSKSLT
ncbi:unnamed protein product [Calypogeia fissa]